MILPELSVILAEELAKLLVANDWTITCAESCTGGGVAVAITSIAGSSQWFERGFITYSNQAKTDLVGVDPATLKQYGAVSQQVVEQMAQGAAKQANAELAISISGIAGPDGGSEEKPVGTVWFGLTLNSHTQSEKQLFQGNRHQVREQAVHFALNYCIKMLQSIN
ncbi:nicotinamide-nucleotide amidase [Neptunicella marina]|uniref:Nicotinamide-nucleotide amidase n=2 Tax=Neptunicella marina TaxID=2125989 RepID=A0A8J6IXB3_9ALTE|nr:nicotinamide-nucleotide amidase [Neptunicella marina]